MIKQNLHTHTTYCDGKNSVEEMVVSAIQHHFTVLGFSGHGYNYPVDHYSMDDESTVRYMEEVQFMKEKYKDKIELYLGVEQDSLGKRFKKGNPYDYILGSVHFLPFGKENLHVDHSKEMSIRNVKRCGGFLNYARLYYEEVKKLANFEEVDIIGHVDLLMKFNENEDFWKFDEEEYLKIAYDCLDCLIEKGKIIEVNTGAIARGMRKTPYPHKILLSYIYEKGGRICLNSDCHNKDDLDCEFESSLELIEKCGFKEMMVLTERGFVKKALTCFRRE